MGYSTTRKVGRGDKMGKAIAGVGAGLLMFLTSFGVLWWNEGRTDMSKVAEGATVVSAEAVNTEAQGQLVSVSGTLDPTGSVGDPQYLAPGNYVRLDRRVEMYAWSEKTEITKETNSRGEEIERTTYSYEEEWTSNPEDSEEFELSDGYVNPKLKISEESFAAPGAKIGAWSLDPADARLPAAEDVVLTKNIVKLPKSRKLRRRTKVGEKSYYYQGWGTPEEPSIGDVRISWSAVPAGLDVTMFAQADQAALVPYMHEGKDKLYRALVGGHDAAISTMSTEHTVMSWILRISGFLMMWIGMSLVFGPLHAALDIIPFVGQGSRVLVGAVLFPVALLLSIVTMVVSMIAHSVIALMLTLVILVGAGVGFYLVRKRSAGPPTPEPMAA